MKCIWNLNDLLKDVNTRYDELMKEYEENKDSEFNYKNFNMLIFAIDNACNVLEEGLKQSKGEYNE